MTGYQVFRSGTQIASLGLTTAYSDTTVAANTSYSYQVRAVDAAGNVSDPSNSATATTPRRPATGADPLPRGRRARTRRRTRPPTTGPPTCARTAAPIPTSRPSCASPSPAPRPGACRAPSCASTPTTAPRTAPPSTRPARRGARPPSTGTRDRPARAADRRQGRDPLNSWVEYDVTPFVTGNGTYSFTLATTSKRRHRLLQPRGRHAAARARGDAALTMPCFAAAAAAAAPDRSRDRRIRRHWRDWAWPTSASPPESGPKVETHVGTTRTSTRSTWTTRRRRPTHQGADRAGAVLGAQGDIVFSTMDCDDRARRSSPRWTPTCQLRQAPISDTTSTICSSRPGRPTDSGSRRSRSAGASTRSTRRPARRSALTTGGSDEAPDWAPRGDWIAFHKQVARQELRHLRRQRRHACRSAG